MISDKSEEQGILRFRLEGVDVSVANALRKALYWIDIVVIDEPTITVNTTGFHNQILAHRISGIPVHCKHLVPGALLTVDVENDGTSPLMVTTEHFKVTCPEGEKNWFPPTTLHLPSHRIESYLDLVSLKNAPSKKKAGEALAFQAGFKLANTKESGMYNAVSTAAYTFTPDPEASERAWEASDKKDRENWVLHESHRYYKPQSYDFTVESVGVHTNSELVVLACSVVQRELKAALETASPQPCSALEHGVEVTLACDYMIGNLLGNHLQADPAVTFSAFAKRHPHDTTGVIRLATTDDPLERLRALVPTLDATFSKIKASFIRENLPARFQRDLDEFLLLPEDQKRTRLQELNEAGTFKDLDSASLDRLDAFAYQYLHHLSLGIPKEKMVIE